jgi:hypothetical protein
VDDRTHVGAVDAHAECVGGDDDVDRAAREALADPAPFLAVDAGVIEVRLPAELAQARALLLGALAGRAVDDRRTARVGGVAERFEEHRVGARAAVLRVHHLGRAQVQFGSREPADELRRFGGQAEPREDLVADDRRGGGGAGEHARLRHGAQQVADLHVVGAKVVAPLADAVRFVDRDQRAVDARDDVAEAAASEALGCDVDELVLAVLDRTHARAQLVGLQRRREVGCGDAMVVERGDLIVHQRDERRNDDRGAGKQRAGKLVDEALAAAGGGDEQ